MSCWYDSFSCWRTVSERDPLGLGNIMSSASKKSRIPLAIRNAGMLIPRAPSSASPASAKISKIAAPKPFPGSPSPACASPNNPLSVPQR
jgi:hypothetical protein